MRIRHVLHLLVPVVLLAACGGGGTTTEKTYTPAQLDTALLTPADVGSGWTQQAHSVPTTTSETTVLAPTTTVVSEFCPAAAGRLAEFERVATDERAVMVTLAAPQATEQRPVGVIEKLWSVDNAKKVFDGMKAALPACVGQTWTVGGGDQVTLASITGLPKIGDDSISVLATSTEPTQTGEVEWYMPMAIARFGNVIVMIQGLDIHDKGTAPTLAVAQLGPIFSTAATKIDGLTK